MILLEGRGRRRERGRGRREIIGKKEGPVFFVPFHRLFMGLSFVMCDHILFLQKKTPVLLWAEPFFSLNTNTDTPTVLLIL